MKELYTPFKSQAKNKKYSVYVRNGSKIKLIHFGDKRYHSSIKHMSYFKINLFIILYNNRYHFIFKILVATVEAIFVVTFPRGY